MIHSNGVLPTNLPRSSSDDIDFTSINPFRRRKILHKHGKAYRLKFLLQSKTFEL
ncbi:MAG: hypothetical protein PHN45_09710 [Methylococcales bacterium]|nr:hypothetical protein [Methylococcales bacterium]MDD5755013.1 hypothetical protein [Methylococcales bacterium]